MCVEVEYPFPINIYSDPFSLTCHFYCSIDNRSSGKSAARRKPYIYFFATLQIGTKTLETFVFFCRPWSIDLTDPPFHAMYLICVLIMCMNDDGNHDFTE